MAQTSSSLRSTAYTFILINEIFWAILIIPLLWNEPMRRAAKRKLLNPDQRTGWLIFWCLMFWSQFFTLIAGILLLMDYVLIDRGN